MRVSNEKATQAGFLMRPLAQTISDILAWYQEERGLDDVLQAGINEEREQALLKHVASDD